MSVLRRNWMRWSCLGALALAGGCGDDSDPVTPVTGHAACESIEADVEGSFDALSQLVAIETYREENFANEDEIAANMRTLYEGLQAQINEFNEGQTTHKLELSEWSQETGDPNEPKYWRVFTLRLGTGPYRVALSTHLDTVSPGDDSVWDPFTLKSEMREHEGVQQEFWVGRGAIDDKGPALVTLQVLETIARAYDGSPLLDDITVELIFDSSEETSMSMPHYLEANPTEEPDLAVIFDAEWCIRAEKGIERPVFTITRDAPPTQGLWIDSLNTPAGPTNQIADRAEAIIRSDSQAELEQLADEIEETYNAYPFDDPEYHRAELTVDTSGLSNNELKLITVVEGAQHGSAPDENREEGANPLVSLANFLAGLVESGDLVDNDVGRMCKFIKWTWGTKVFGENHPDLLERHDDVFESGNGTTYAVTRFSTGEPSEGEITLRVDIRYAIGHHSESWDGETEGFLCGEESIFAEVFTTLVDEFNTASSGPPVAFTTGTSAVPDIRLPEGPTFSKISQAYQDVMGVPCPARAIGGGTDAKGQTKFLAAGALFSTTLGPPINFHGLDEGAPVRELTQSANILCSLVDQEIQHAAEAVHGGEEPTDNCGTSASKTSRPAKWLTGPLWH